MYLIPLLDIGFYFIAIAPLLLSYCQLSRWLSGKEPACNAGDTGDAGSIPGQEDPLEEETTTHSSILAWKIPWKEEPSRLQSMGLQRVWHNWVCMTTSYCGFFFVFGCLDVGCFFVFVFVYVLLIPALFVDGCSTVTCYFGVLIRRVELRYFYFHNYCYFHLHLCTSSQKLEK